MPLILTILFTLALVSAGWAQSPDDLQRQLAVQQRLAEINERKANAETYQVLMEYFMAEAKRLAKENKALKQELEEQKPCEPSSSE